MTVRSQIPAEKLAKLPKYAQEYIEDLERTLETAEETLDRYVNVNQDGQFSFGDLVCLKETRALERKVDAIRMRVEHADIHLEVSIAHDDRIELRWTAGPDKYGLGDVAFIPTSYQHAKLIHPSKTITR